MSAEFDLPYYFGSGPCTRLGEAGVGSTFGQMLDRAMGSRLSKEARQDSRELDDETRERVKRWMAQPQTDTTPNVSALEDQLLHNVALGGERRAQRIESKLAALTGAQLHALRLHFGGQRTPMPYEVSPCAVMVLSARRLCGTNGDPFLSELREALKKATVEQREQITEDAKTLLAAAIKAYNEASEVTVRRAQIDDPRPWKR